ncbi:MAG: cyclic nucleotide-binding domain-containing protein [Nitrospirae bacterium]|nr:cyclic nucleotide-binding domain-containing protein [Nitrospirota bacterium]
MGHDNWETYFKAVRKQDWRSAGDVLRQIAAQDRNNPQTFLKIGDICQRTGEKTEAIAAYTHAAQVLRMQGFVQKALAAYKIALRLDPDNQEIIRRAEILMDEFEEAKTAPHFPSPPPLQAPLAAERKEPSREAAVPETTSAHDWLERTSVVPDKAAEETTEEIQTAATGSWLETTSLSPDLPAGPGSSARLSSEERNDAGASPLERPAGENLSGHPEGQTEPSPDAVEDWLESAYEALDTKMFRTTGGQAGSPSGTESSPIDLKHKKDSGEPKEQTFDDLMFQQRQHRAPDVPAEMEHLAMPLSERRDSGIPDMFSDVPEDMMRSFMNGLSILTFKDGQRVIEEGDSGDSLYIIRSGTANVVAHLLGRRIELAVLGEGDVFGEVGFLTGRPRTASVIASGRLEVYEVTRLEIEKLIESAPDVIARLEGFYEKRVRDTIRKIKN